MTIRGKRDTIINQQIPDNLYYDDQKILQQVIQHLRYSYPQSMYGYINK